VPAFLIGADRRRTEIRRKNNLSPSMLPSYYIYVPLCAPASIGAFLSELIHTPFINPGIYTGVPLKKL